MRIDAADHHRAGQDRPRRRRGVQPAVAARADMQHVLRENRQQRGRRRKERREKIEQHRRSNERRAEDEAQAVECRRDAEIAAIARVDAVDMRRPLSLHQHQRGDDEQERHRVDRVHPADVPYAIISPPSAGPPPTRVCIAIVFRLIAFGRSSRERGSARAPGAPGDRRRRPRSCRRQARRSAIPRQARETSAPRAPPRAAP